jgi:hypothetical protein
MDVLKKYACVFYVDVFRVRHGVIRQIQDKFVFHLEGIHYMTHHTNLMVETLFQIPIV